MSQLSLFNKPSTITPLSYVGGKKILYRQIINLIPSGTTEVVSPFSGAAGLELKIAGSGIRMHCHDIFVPNPHFFTMFNGESNRVVEIAKRIYPISREQFLEYGDNDGEKWHAIECPYEAAAVYWIATKQGYSGYGFASTPSSDPARHSIKPSYWKRKEWKNWENPYFSYEEQDWKVTLGRYPDAVLYCDPPYVGKSKFYGWKGGQPEFDHEQFRDAIRWHNGPAMISYAPHPDIDSLYKGFHILRLSWKNSLSKNKDGTQKNMTELLILKDIAPPGYGYMVHS